MGNYGSRNDFPIHHSKDDKIVFSSPKEHDRVLSLSHGTFILWTTSTLYATIFFGMNCSHNHILADAIILVEFCNYSAPSCNQMNIVKALVYCIQTLKNWLMTFINELKYGHFSLNVKNDSSFTEFNDACHMALLQAHNKLTESTYFAFHDIPLADTVYFLKSQDALACSTCKIW